MRPTHERQCITRRARCLVDATHLAENAHQVGVQHVGVADGRRPGAQFFTQPLRLGGGLLDRADLPEQIDQVVASDDLQAPVAGRLAQLDLGAQQRLRVAKAAFAAGERTLTAQHMDVEFGRP